MQFVEKNVSYRNVLLQWKDYISFCEELGYDLKNTFVLFPKNLWEAHDEASAEVLRKREEERKEQIQREEQMAKALLQEYIHGRMMDMLLLYRRIYSLSKKKGMPYAIVSGPIRQGLQMERALSFSSGM